MNRLELLRRAVQTFDLEVGSDPAGGYLVPTGRPRRRKKPKTKESGYERTGVMVGVSVDPVLASQIAIDEGEDPDNLHLTLAYCGNAADLDVQDLASAIASLTELAKRSSPLSGVIGGIGRFMASETSDGRDVFYASVDVPGLVELRVAITDVLARSGIPAKANHGFSPHITLAYLAPSDPSPFERIQSRPFLVSDLTFQVGEQEIILSLLGTSVKYSDDQPRDSSGRWGAGGGAKPAKDERAWNKTITDNEREALFSWKTIEEFRALSKADAGKGGSAKTQQTLKTLYGVAGRAPLGAKTIYRGVALSTTKDLRPFAVGNRLDLKSLTSFSSSKSVADSFGKGKWEQNRGAVRVLLQVNNNTIGRDISKAQLSMRGHGREREVLVPKGVSYKITAIKDVTIKKGWGYGRQVRFVTASQVK